MKYCIAYIILSFVCILSQALRASEELLPSENQKKSPTQVSSKSKKKSKVHFEDSITCLTDNLQRLTLQDDEKYPHTRDAVMKMDPYFPLFAKYQKGLFTSDLIYMIFDDYFTTRDLLIAQRWAKAFYQIARAVLEKRIYGRILKDPERVGLSTTNQWERAFFRAKFTYDNRAQYSVWKVAAYGYLLQKSDRRSASPLCMRVTEESPLEEQVEIMLTQMSFYASHGQSLVLYDISKNVPKMKPGPAKTLALIPIDFVFNYLSFMTFDRRYANFLKRPEIVKLFNVEEQKTINLMMKAFNVFYLSETLEGSEDEIDPASLYGELMAIKLDKYQPFYKKAWAQYWMARLHMMGVGTVREPIIWRRALDNLIDSPNLNVPAKLWILRELITNAHIQQGPHEGWKPTVREALSYCDRALSLVQYEKYYLYDPIVLDADVFEGLKRNLLKAVKH
ncbi:hypothetical protein GQ61_04075 [Candidatus Nucleicultrix amoebiphila FS5]|jgi:hypothetical protein|uniref:Uncharacterized protein n=2 Tax=Candidatus Nucleicultrix TaxID=1509243 RepID=A0A1W6N453_9PROT|nr:hypothetical protein GQ61_04075 [Candidatus Nucleicultrix amoebiphila FS5]